MKQNKNLQNRNPVKKFLKGDGVMNKNEFIAGPNVERYQLSLFPFFQA